MPPVRTWREDAVLKLIGRHRDTEPESIVRNLAEKVLAETGSTRLPIDVEGIASFLGIKRRLGDFPFAGRIFAEPNGQLVMDLTKNDRDERRRFTCGHEVAHTWFPGFKREHRYRVDQKVGNNDPRRAEEEYLCDLGAAELLMPRSLVRDSYSARDGLDDLEQLASDARASLEASGNRLIELADGPAVFIVLELGHKPADRPALRRGVPVPKRLRIKYARTANLNLYVPRFKSVPEDDVIWDAFESDSIVRGLGSLPTRGHPDFYIEAKRCDRAGPEGTVGRVLVIAHPVKA